GLCRLVDAGLDVALRAFPMLEGDERAQLSLGVDARADLHARRCPGGRFGELLRRWALDVDAAVCRADLAAVEQPALEDPRDRVLKRSVGEDDDRVLAS